MSPVVADVLLAREQVVDDDRALQADLEIDRRALRQVFLVELLAAHDHARPRLGVVGLVADHELDRLADLAEVDVGRKQRKSRPARLANIAPANFRKRLLSVMASLL